MNKQSIHQRERLSRAANASLDFKYVRNEANRYGIVVLQITVFKYRFIKDGMVFTAYPSALQTNPIIQQLNPNWQLCDVLNAVRNIERYTGSSAAFEAMETHSHVGTGAEGVANG